MKKFNIVLCFGMFLFSLSSLSMDLVTSKPIKSIPCPELGKRWIVNRDFSDEFNGDKLDESKWYNYHPTWKGRAPGLFSKENVSQGDGFLKLRSDVPDEPIILKNKDNSTTTYNITNAACISKKTTASYGYYECRFKANKLSLSSTFWFSSRSSFKNPEAGTYGQELDVCECIGDSGNFAGSFFSEGMNSNVHYWYSLDGKKYDMRAKLPNTKESWKTGIEQKLGKGILPSDDFHTYGCWWKDSKNAVFYLDDREGIEMPFSFVNKEMPRTDASKFEINHPMGMNLVTEVYPSPWIKIPALEKIKDPNLSTTLYDWVRSYVQVNCDEKNPDKEKMEMFEKHIHCTARPMVSDKKLKVNLVYTASEDCNIKIVIYNKEGKRVNYKNFKAYAGYSNNEYNMYSKLGRRLKKDEVYYVFCYLLPKKSYDIKDAYEADSYMTLVK